MRRVLYTITFFFYVSSLLACDYLSQSGCKDGQRCIFSYDPNAPVCLKKFKASYPKIGFPFSSSRIVTCDQGPHMPGEASHSHAWINAMDALDLRTRDSESAGKIYAGLSGKAIVYDSCSEFNTHCGAGFGNQVKIFNNEGYIVFYAHLEKVLVKNWQEVKAGDLIGIEGSTGLTGKGNRHLHVSVHFDWRYKGYLYWSQLGWLPRSIPFSFDVFESISSQNVIEKNTKTIRCIRREEDNFQGAALRGGSSY